MAPYIYADTERVAPLSRSITMFKPVTDEQVFYDKFSYDKFYLPNARDHVCICNIFYMTSFHEKFYFTGVNVSTSLL